MVRFIDFYQLPEVQLILHRLNPVERGINIKLCDILGFLIDSKESCSSWELKNAYYISDLCDLYQAEKSLKKGDSSVRVRLYRYCIEEVLEYLQDKYSPCSIELETKNWENLEDSLVVTFHLHIQGG